RRVDGGWVRRSDGGSARGTSCRTPRGVPVWGSPAAGVDRGGVAADAERGSAKRPVTDVAAGRPAAQSLFVQIIGMSSPWFDGEFSTWNSSAHTRVKQPMQS